MKASAVSFCVQSGAYAPFPDSRAAPLPPHNHAWRIARTPAFPPIGGVLGRELFAPRGPEDGRKNARIDRVQSDRAATRIHSALMRLRQPHPPSEHRLTRLFVWFAMILGWFAFGAPHERRRRNLASITCGVLRRTMRNLIVIRVAALQPPRKITPWRNHGRSGFQRRRNRCSLRAIGGSWLRKRLKVRGGLVTQARHLLDALRQFSAFVVALARRRRRGLSRLNPLVLTRALNLRVTNLCDAVPSLADSS